MNRHSQDTSVIGLLNTFDVVVLVTVLLGVAGLMILYFAIPNLVTDGEICKFFGNLNIPCLDLHNFVQSVASSAIPVGITSVLGYIFLRHAQNLRERQRNSDLAVQVASEIEQSLTNHAGIQKRFTELGIVDCERSLDNVKEKALDLHYSDVKIMTTWFTHAGVLHQLFDKAAKHRNYRIRILLLDPTSEVAKQRSRDLGEVHEDTVPNHIRACRAEIEGFDMKVEIRYYNALPSFPLYIFGNHAFFGVFPHGARADRGPWFAIDLRDTNDRQTEIGKYLLQEFETVWRAAV